MNSRENAGSRHSGSVSIAFACAASSVQEPGSCEAAGRAERTNIPFPRRVSDGRRSDQAIVTAMPSRSKVTPSGVSPTRSASARLGTPTRPPKDSQTVGAAREGVVEIQCTRLERVAPPMRGRIRVPIDESSLGSPERSTAPASEFPRFLLRANGPVDLTRSGG